MSSGIELRDSSIEGSLLGLRVMEQRGQLPEPPMDPPPLLHHLLFHPAEHFVVIHPAMTASGPVRMGGLNEVTPAERRD